MDSQLIFFLSISVLLLGLGILVMNIIVQLGGIVLLLFLIYDYYSNYKEKQKYKNISYSKLKFLGSFGGCRSKGHMSYPNNLLKSL